MGEVEETIYTIEEDEDGEETVKVGASINRGYKCSAEYDRR